MKKLILNLCVSIVPLAPARLALRANLRLLLLTSALLLSACSSTPKYFPSPYPIGYAPDSPEVASAPPRRVAPAAPPAVTSTEVITESRYKDGKLKQREVVSKSEYKKGNLIKHQSVERKIISESNKIQ